MKGLKRVLLIEDDDTVNFFNEFLIRQMGFKGDLKISLNGQEALDYLIAIPPDESWPDLILLDINMPVLNGFGFLNGMRDQKIMPSPMPIIYLLTTSTHPEDQRKAREHDCVKGFLDKPLSREVLEDICKLHFSGPQPV